MQFFEILLLIITFSLLVTLSFFGRHRNLQQQLFLIGLGTLVLHILIETARWQMSLIYFILIISGLFHLKKSISHLFLRSFRFLLATILVFTSVFYSLTMPILTLNGPSGEYTVGTTILKMLDENREEYHTQNPNDKRELLVEIWYPSMSNPSVLPRSIWSGLYSGKSDIISYLTGYLRNVKTHSFPNLQPANGTYPLILFNHGLQMFTSQNTLLMEHLASHGYIVASIGHPYESIRVDFGQDHVVLPEFVTSFKKFNEGMQWVEEASSPMTKAKEEIKFIEDREKRSKIVLDAIQKADGLNKMVSLWASDNEFVLDKLLENSKKKLALIPNIDSKKIGVMGMSIGGAAAGEFSKIDIRIKAGINIDGLQYGTTQMDTLKVPFMMVYSDDGQGINDFMFLKSNQNYYEYHLKNTRHADLTDMAIVWPILKIYGQAGPLSGNRVTKIMNSIILKFWDSHLKNIPEIDLLKTPFSEIKIKSNTN